MWLQLTLWLLLAGGLQLSVPAQATPQPVGYGGQLCVHEALPTELTNLTPWVIGTHQPRVAEALRREHGLLARVYEDQAALHQAAATGQVKIWWCTQQPPATLSLLFPHRVQAPLSLEAGAVPQYPDDTLVTADEQQIALRESEQALLLDYDPLVVGVPEDSSPIIRQTPEGQVEGMDVDVLRLLAARLNINLRWESCGNWAECIQALARRDIDVLSFFTPSEERQLFANFTIPYWEVPWGLVAPEYQPLSADSYAQLTDTRVAVVEGYSVIADLNVAGVPVLVVDSPSAGIQAVLAGEADAYLDSLPMLMERAQEQLAGNLRVTVLRDEPGDNISLGVRNDYAGLVEVLDRAILAITEQEREQIEERWFRAELDETGVNDRLQFWLQVASVLVLVGMGIGVSRVMLLRRKVHLHESRAEEYRHQARHDALTGLPNREQLMARLETQIAREANGRQSLALLFIDLDGFKRVNDEQGHAAGDTMLQLVAKRLLNTVRETDVVARFGGDEFVVLLTGLNETSEAVMVGYKIIDRLSRPYRIEDRLATISASIGVAAYPEHGTGGEALLEAADKAMYRVKRGGKSDVYLPPG